MTFIYPGTSTDLVRRDCRWLLSSRGCLLISILAVSVVLNALSGLSAPGTAEASESMAVDDTGLAEITVIAQKYESTIQDTPISISALSGERPIDAGITSVMEVTRDVRGLSMRSAGPGFTEYEARGLASTGGAAPPVGFYLDEVPLSPPSVLDPARS